MLQPQVSRGGPRPLGASLFRGGINFSLFSKHATHVVLVLFNESDGTKVEIPLDPRVNRTGDVWHALVRIQDGDPDYGWRMKTSYCWRLDRQVNDNPLVHRFDPSKLLLCPYATAITGGEKWGPHSANTQRRCLVTDSDFDWKLDQPLNIPLAASVIYELHVRGYTCDPSSGVAKPGTFLGLTEKIPYLRDLGVTAVELLPVNEFEEADTDRWNPKLGTSLLNLWGYQPIAFFAPNAPYAANPSDGSVVNEFKEMVRLFHAAGIEVILDVVFNHTSEGDERGLARSFRGIDNATYYIIDPVTGRYMNFSGCGNTMNCNHPVVRKMISDCLQYWVTDMHVDGFRFDLASILGRGRDGEVLANPPLLEELASEPVLANTKLIAEAWDAAGLYQVGTFPSWGRWAEWNGRFRDDIRRFLRGDQGMVSALATRLVGSDDLYLTSGREPWHSINFVTCHDGFTLRDLVSYNSKHNELNGENNSDGSNENYSCNFGVEGETDDVAINRIRLQQQKNFAAILLLSHGVPMILAGDEMGRTQRGNNNAYCQDNEISWINWKLVEENSELVRFFRNLIEFRKAFPLVRRQQYDDHMIVNWHGVRKLQPDWAVDSHSLGLELTLDSRKLFLIVNAYWEDLDFELPNISNSATWRRILDTSLESPNDIADPEESFSLTSQTVYQARSRSVAAFIA